MRKHPANLSASLSGRRGALNVGFRPLLDWGLATNCAYSPIQSWSLIPERATLNYSTDTDESKVFYAVTLCCVLNGRV